MLAIVQIPWQHKSNTSYAGALYAALDVIGSGNPELAQRVHDDNRLPPFSSSLYKGLLRIGTLTTDVFMAVAQSKLAYKAERLAVCSFDDIITKASNDRRVSISFLTPAALGGFGNQTALPDPKWVFGSLVNRWRRFGGPVIPELRYDESCIVLADIEVRKVEIGDYSQRGNVGQVVYLVPEDVASWYNALADFAEFSGVGRKTTQGLGQVRRARS